MTKSHGLAMVRALAKAAACVLLMGSFCAAAADPVTYYVSTSGRDKWSGKVASPTVANGPFATIERALQASRSLREANPARAVTVKVQPGLYRLARTLTLGPEDSGLVIEGDKAHATVISGGRRIAGFKPWKGKILRAKLSKPSLESLPDLDFQELYYNGKLMNWARYPNFEPEHPRTGGFLQSAGVAEAGTTTQLMYTEGQLHPEKWTHPERAWVMFHDSLNYETQYCPVSSIDTQKRTLDAAKGVYPLGVGSPYYVCGILEELDAPGEWCVDPDTETLYFWPPSGNPNKADEAVVPALTSIISLEGSAADGQWARSIRVSGLAIRDCRGAAVNMTGVKDCAIVASDIRNAGSAVYIGNGTHGCRVVGCDITQTQGDGITIWGNSANREAVTDHVIDNNYIWDTGWGRVLTNQCAGVDVCQAMRVKITNNHIHDTPRYAIGMNSSGGCEVAYNYCHDANLVTLDTGIIEAVTSWDWSLSNDEQVERNRKWNWGNSIHHNILRGSGGWGLDYLGNLKSPNFSWGIYLDLYSSGWQVRDNLISDTVLGAYMVNGGNDNVFENNVVLNGKENQAYLSTWPNYTTKGNRVERNIFGYSAKPANLYLVRNTSKEAYSFSNNLIWPLGAAVSVSGVSAASRASSWGMWRELGQDAGSVVADPEFVDSTQPDWHLKPSSPAFGVGFKAIDLSRTGNYASSERRTWPRTEVKVVRDALDYTPPPTLDSPQIPLRDYEGYAPGEPERGAYAGSEGEGTILVTEETAAGGVRSLKFTDAANLSAVWLPYVTYPLVQETGSLTMSFDMRWEKGALMTMEWRDAPAGYTVGPSLSTTAAGRLYANGKKTVQMPEGKWVHIELNCPLGDGAAGKYDLSVTLPDSEAQMFRSNSSSAKFREVNTIVIMAMGDTPAAFYIDNLAFGPRN